MHEISKTLVVALGAAALAIPLACSKHNTNSGPQTPPAPTTETNTESPGTYTPAAGTTQEPSGSDMNGTAPPPGTTGTGTPAPDTIGTGGSSSGDMNSDTESTGGKGSGGTRGRSGTGGSP